MEYCIQLRIHIENIIKWNVLLDSYLSLWRKLSEKKILKLFVLSVCENMILLYISGLSWFKSMAIFVGTWFYSLFKHLIDNTLTLSICMIEIKVTVKHLSNVCVCNASIYCEITNISGGWCLSNLSILWLNFIKVNTTMSEEGMYNVDCRTVTANIEMGMA